MPVEAARVQAVLRSIRKRLNLMFAALQRDVVKQASSSSLTGDVHTQTNAWLQRAATTPNYTYVNVRSHPPH